MVWWNSDTRRRWSILHRLFKTKRWSVYAEPADSLPKSTLHHDLADLCWPAEARNLAIRTWRNLEIVSCRLPPQNDTPPYSVHARLLTVPFQMLDKVGRDPKNVCPQVFRLGHEELCRSRTILVWGVGRRMAVVSNFRRMRTSWELNNWPYSLNAYRPMLIASYRSSNLLSHMSDFASARSSSEVQNGGDTIFKFS